MWLDRWFVRCVFPELMHMPTCAFSPKLPHAHPHPLYVYPFIYSVLKGGVQQKTGTQWPVSIRRGFQKLKAERVSGIKQSTSGTMLSFNLFWKL